MKGAGIIAAAMALPAAAAIVPVAHAADEAEIIHGPYCFHGKRRLPDRSPERHALEEELGAHMTHEQWVLHDRIVHLATDLWADEQDIFVEELCRHFPGLAPGIRYIAYHHISSQSLADRGACCEEEGA